MSEGLKLDQTQSLKHKLYLNMSAIKRKVHYCICKHLKHMNTVKLVLFINNQILSQAEWLGLN